MLSANQDDRPTTLPNRLLSYLPVLAWLPDYDRSWLRADLMGGAVTAAVVIPQAIAYASIAGLPVQVGLYVAVMPMLVYALLGTSRVLSVSSTSTISMLVATALAEVVQSQDATNYIVPAATLAFLVGILLMAASFLKLGAIANFISLPVLIGFKAGIGVVIIVGQLPKVLGLAIPKLPVLQTLLAAIANLNHIHWTTFSLTLITMAILLALPRVNRYLPEALVAVALGIAAAATFNLAASGVKLLGEIPAGLPKLSLPDLALFHALWPSALGIALISFVESIASARAFVRADDPPLDANQELFALGMANLAGGFTQAYPAGGGTSQTAVNSHAGARTQAAQMVTAAVTVATLLFLTPLISLMPQATLGALVMVAAVGLVKVGEFQKIARFRRVELWWALAAFAGVIFLGTLRGIVTAVMVSMLAILHISNHPPVYQLARKPGTDIYRRLGNHAEDITYPGLLLMRSEGLLYFANAGRVIDRYTLLIQQLQPRVVVLECSAIPNIEYTALTLLTDFERKLASQGTQLWLATLNPNVYAVIDGSDLGKRLTHARMFLSVQRAVESYLTNMSATVGEAAR